MGWRRHRQMLEAGNRAPEFTLASLDGTPKSLNEILAGGPVILAFFKVSCPVCQYTFPFLQRLHESTGGDRVRVYAISQDNARDTRGFNSAYRISFPTLLDDRSKGYPASNAFGVSVVPSVFLIEKDGTIGYAMSGFSKSEMESVGRRAGLEIFHADEHVPEWKAG
ncbi:MAG: TlpA family protein disulfide reductase [Acidobacteria bacterium]|nr:TlpA family protein disulfide reductase [Acidobacteriota bacterium]